jgi:2-succinyl-5-enolpyruvyl-6-hydroxy-3-cyclohexene-1-carboxylate synthase
VSRLLERPDVELVLVQDREDVPGPERTDARRLPAEALDEVRQGPAAPPTEWLAAWQRAGAAAATAIDRVLDGWPDLCGPLAAREVAAATEPGDALVAAASNPVRDLDLAGKPWDEPRFVHANRGVSGIDGTVSTAAGLALATGRPTRVLVGDVAWLHDLGGLVLGPHEQVPDLTVVVLNDGGGGIFSLLEQGAEAERDPAAAQRFERLFGTPHEVDLEATCAGLGVGYARVADGYRLRAQLARRPRGLTVLEVPIVRPDLRRLHERLAAAVHAAIVAPIYPENGTSGAEIGS